MKKVFSVVLMIAVLCSPALADDAMTDIVNVVPKYMRGTKWGMSPEEVRKIEAYRLQSETTPWENSLYLEFWGEINDELHIVKYFFKNRLLFRIENDIHGRYMFHTEILPVLEKKYGKPDSTLVLTNADGEDVGDYIRYYTLPDSILCTVSEFSITGSIDYIPIKYERILESIREANKQSRMYNIEQSF